MADKRSKKPPREIPTSPSTNGTQESTQNDMKESTRMPLKVNFANVGQVLPPSIYTAQLTEVKVGQAKSSGGR